MFWNSHSLLSCEPGNSVGNEAWAEDSPIGILAEALKFTGFVMKNLKFYFSHFIRFSRDFAFPVSKLLNSNYIATLFATMKILDFQGLFFENVDRTLKGPENFWNINLV